jgi:hypothetical protein
VKSLTVRQPWAWAILHAGKNIENRSWAPKAVLPFQIAVHAGAHCTASEYDAALDSIWRDGGPEIYTPLREDLVLGCVVGVVDVIGVERRNPGSPWWMGPIGWRLANPRPLVEPVPCRGARGLWDLPADVERDVIEQLKEKP